MSTQKKKNLNFKKKNEICWTLDFVLRFFFLTNFVVVIVLSNIKKKNHEIKKINKIKITQMGPSHDHCSVGL